LFNTALIATPPAPPSFCSVNGSAKEAAASTVILPECVFDPKTIDANPGWIRAISAVARSNPVFPALIVIGVATWSTRLN